MIVADTNILVYRLLPNSRTANIVSLVKNDSVWAAPILWRSEVRSALASHMRAGDIHLNETAVLMRMARSFLLGGEHAISDSAVFELVAQSRCSAYDCEYVALAEALGTVLVTEDAALRKAFPQRCRSIAQMI